MKKPILKKPTKKISKSVLNYLFLTLLGLVIFNSFVPQQYSNQVSYSEIKSNIREGKIKKVTITGENVIGELSDSEATRLNAEKKDKSFVPPFKSISAARLGDDPELVKLLDETKVPYEFKAQENPTRDFFLGLLGWIVPFLLMFALWRFMFQKMGPGSEVMRFGKSKNTTKPEESLTTTFNDIAGQDEAKEELKEVVEFLKEPGRFTQLGGKLPKGILLVGPPGTGKTLLAKAVAGEAKVPFFSISGSDFVEMFVGVGAARVRDLFAQAKAQAPCIIFIDELDAVGKARGAGPMGGHDEREQTLNQLLVEMDGFDTQKGIMIVAATNRPEILDPALLRAGRFDRQVLVGRPDVKERLAILQLHAKNIKLDPTVDLNNAAKSTPGMVGADLANIVNEAALLAARRGSENVQAKDFEDAIERVLTGLEKKKRVINKREKEIVAHHEAGHALISALRNAADRVTKISIIPRGIGALGYTMQLPTEDRYLMSMSELMSKIDVLLGGQAAEKVIFDEISTGASDDLQRATNIARSMITQYGMGKTLGPVTVDRDRTPMMMDSGGFSAGKNFSEETARQIDEEIRDMMKERMAFVQNLLREKLPLLREIAQQLLEKEALNEEEFTAIMTRAGVVPAAAVA